MTTPTKKPRGRPPGSKSKPKPPNPKFARRANYKERGAPSTYQPIYAEQVKILYANGATDREVAEFFHVSTSTIQRWLVSIDEFRLQAWLGHNEADKARLHRVRVSLYHRAVGYSYEAEKIAIDAKTGAIARTTYLEHVPPDVTAAMKWLTNRDPENWRDKIEQHHTGEVTLLDLVRASFEPSAPAAELPAPSIEDESK